MGVQLKKLLALRSLMRTSLHKFLLCPTSWIGGLLQDLSNCMMVSCPTTHFHCSFPRWPRVRGGSSFSSVCPIVAKSVFNFSLSFRLKVESEVRPSRLKGRPTALQVELNFGEMSGSSWLGRQLS